jgi:predicted nucleic acid-binding protein
MEAFAALAERGVRMVTSNYVFGETYTTLLARSGHRKAVLWGSEFRKSRAVQLIRVGEEVEDAAWGILESHADKRWNYVDAVSFALMEREGISTAFAFDQHFSHRGLAVIPA